MPLDPRARMSLAFLSVGGLASLVIAAGWGARPSPSSYVAYSTEPWLSEIANPEERELWNLRSCATCHGPEGRGTPMGPDLQAVVPLYLRAAGSPEKAVARIVAYLMNPKHTDTLRTGPAFPNPMPPITKTGGTQEEAETLARMLVR